jgi:hypothetical protein
MHRKHIRKLKGKGPFGKPQHHLDSNIKTDLEEIR